MTTFDEYSTRYSSVRMRREDGILEMQFHTNGGPLRWSKLAHGDLEGAFLDAGRDRDNEVVIITGTGDEYAGPAVQPSGQGGHHNPKKPLDAQEAKELGLVSEVLPRDKLLPRAWELARQLRQRPTLMLRYSRVMLTQDLKRRMHDLLGYGLALEGLAAVQRVE